MSGRHDPGFARTPKLFALAAILMAPAMASAQVVRIPTAPTPGPTTPSVRAVVDATYFVRAGPTNGNGSQSNPFNSITAALTAANSPLVRSVTVNIAAGQYTERIEITKPTSIVGAARPFPALPLAVLHGTITNLRGNALSITNLTIRDGQAAALTQAGGTLRLTGVGLHWVAAGTALQLSGGVQAVLENVSLTSNTGQAIRVEGRGTRFWSRGLNASANKARTDAVAQATEDNPSHVAAVEISDGAVAYMNQSVIDGNEAMGLLVHRGAQVHFENGTVNRTRRASGTQEWGHNIVVSSNATVELIAFHSDSASYAGVFLKSAFLSAHGVVQDNWIGMVAQGTSPEPGLDLLQCLGDVSWINNQTKLSADFLPLPDLGVLYGPSSNPYAGCKTVPWVSAPAL